MRANTDTFPAVHTGRPPVAGPQLPAAGGPATGVAPRLRRLGLVWLILLPLAGIAAVTLVMQAAGIAGWDDAAHLYKITLLRDHRAFVWDNNWYGGAYEFITYGFVFYWLAQFVSYKLIVVVSTGAMPVLFHLYMRRRYHVASFVPAIVLAAVLLGYLANGQDPFLFAMSLVMLGMVLFAYDRVLFAALVIGASIFANPVAVLIGALFMVGDYVAHPAVRWRTRRLALYLAPFVVARGVLAVVFYERADYLFSPAELLLFTGFGALGFIHARVSRDQSRRAFETIFLAFIVLALLVVLIPSNPVGATIGRFFYLFGLPLFLAIRAPRGWPGLRVAAIAAIMFGQAFTPVMHFVHIVDLPSTKASFFAPALDYAAAHSDPNYRFHVVALDTHWEAYYFSVNGFPITRGWYRQADALHNEVLTKEFTSLQYVTWLRDMGVKYVFLPHAPLDYSGELEASVLRSSPEFTRVHESSQWTIYEVRRPEPLAVSLTGAEPADVLALQHEAIYLNVPRAGTYMIKISYSPHWRVSAGAGEVAKGPAGFLALKAGERGFYAVRMKVSLGSSLGEIVRAVGGGASPSASPRP